MKSEILKAKIETCVKLFCSNLVHENATTLHELDMDICSIIEDEVLEMIDNCGYKVDKDFEIIKK